MSRKWLCAKKVLMMIKTNRQDRPANGAERQRDAVRPDQTN